MYNRHASSDRAATRNVVLAIASGLTAASLIAIFVLAASPREAAATAAYAGQTGLPCGQCHSNPAGGGKLKSFGEKFKANGHKVK